MATPSACASSSADRYSISPGYLRTMGIPLLRGRQFDDRDTAASAKVVLVNDSMARKFWPGEDPIGKRLRMGNSKAPLRTVVGVVGDVLHRSLAAPHTLQIYLPNAQFTDSDVILAVRGEIAALDPQVPVSEIATMDEVVSASVTNQRFIAILFFLFAAIALLLATVGIYVISYSVAQRTHEIGIRVALGAHRGEVLRLIIGEAMGPALLGAAAGLCAAFGLTRLLTGLLFGVRPSDPPTFALVSLILLAVALLACYLPPRRATRVDPVIALRYE
jgi:putative ABC transport system permease protein